MTGWSGEKIAGWIIGGCVLAVLVTATAAACVWIWGVAT